MKIILPTYILVSRTKSMPIHLLTNKSNSSMEILKSYKHCLIFGCLAILSLPTHTISYFRKSTKVFLVYHLWRKRYDFHTF